MNKTNWPFRTDLSDSNWTGRTPRTRKHYGTYRRANERIPPVAWVVGVSFLGIVFGLVPFMKWMMT